MSRMSCGIDAGTIRTSQQPWSQTTGVVGAAVCVRWLLRGRADRARVSGYWCSEMMLVVRCGDAWMARGRRRSGGELLCLFGRV